MTDVAGGPRIAGAALVCLVAASFASTQAPAQGSQSAAPGPADASQTALLSLSAGFSADAKPIRTGLVWRVFKDAGADPELVARSEAATPSIPLARGDYAVVATYGFAVASARVSVGGAPRSERLVLDAGGLKLGGEIGDVPIPANRISFSVFAPVGNDSEGRLVAANIKAGDVIRVPTGNYRVVSTYGESNAIMRVDLKVEPGRLTEATVNHRAATLTLKLVSAPRGEAFAGTSFTVLTPGGDVIREAIGAFPTVTLAEGEYVLIARNNGNVYTRDFKVESGLDRDVEAVVQASSPAAASPPG